MSLPSGFFTFLFNTVFGLNDQTASEHVMDQRDMESAYRARSQEEYDIFAQWQRMNDQ